MNRRTFLQSAILGGVLLAIPGCLSRKSKNSPESSLNFLFILVDDLGWADVGCYGSRFYETPNIDRLASGGMKYLSIVSMKTS